MTSQFSPKVSEILAFSREEARRLSCSYVGPEHLLLAMMRMKEGPVFDIFQRLSIQKEEKNNKEEKKSEEEKKVNNNGNNQINNKISAEDRLKVEKYFEDILLSIRALASSICFSMLVPLAAKSPEPPSEQKIHPPVEMLPSLFGQVHPLVSDNL